MRRVSWFGVGNRRLLDYGLRERLSGDHGRPLPDLFSASDGSPQLPSTTLPAAATRLKGCGWIVAVVLFTLEPGNRPMHGALAAATSARDLGDRQRLRVPCRDLVEFHLG